MEEIVLYVRHDIEKQMIFLNYLFISGDNYQKRDNTREFEDFV